MANTKNLKEEIFGNVSDCKGMNTGGNACKAIPEGIVTHTPRYHEGEQVDPETVVVSNNSVTEKELSSHF